MEANLIIDDAKKHFVDSLPDDVHLDQAYLHIGMFLGWIIDQGLYSEMFEEESETQIYRFKCKDISCIILGHVWDGLIFDDQFTNPAGAEFTNYYYKSGMYLMDFKKTLAADLPSMFYVDDSWENFQIMKAKIDERYAEWKEMREAKDALDQTLKQIPKPESVELKLDNPPPADEENSED